MTDNVNEIICALDKLKYGNHTYGDSVTAKNAIDFINSQQAEIERLEKELYTETNHNERLYKKIDRLVAGAYNINKIKSEAIKEFAERVLELFPFDKMFTTISRGTIRTIANELTHQPKKIEHNSLCETETYESR